MIAEEGVYVSGEVWMVGYSSVGKTNGFGHCEFKSEIAGLEDLVDLNRMIN